MKQKFLSGFVAILVATFLGIVHESDAAIALVQTIGTATATNTDNTISITVPASGVTAGNSIILTFTANDERSTAYSATDSKGNSYHVDAQAVRNKDVRTVVFSARNVVGLTGGDVITVTHPTTVKRAAAAFEFAGLANTGVLDQTETSHGNDTTADSGHLNPEPPDTYQPAELLFGAIGVQAPVTETFTPGTDGKSGNYYTLLAHVGTEGGKDWTLNAEYEIVNTISKYHARGTLSQARYWTAAIAIYKGIDTGCGNDTTPPTITCPAISTNTAEGGCTQIVTYSAQVTDNCAVASVTYNPPSGSTFSIGTAIVTVTATDVVGNSNSSTFSVTVNDTTPPVITCATNKTVVCGSIWSFDEPTAQDICCGTNVTITLLDTAVNETNALEVTRTWKATDCWSNSVTCSQTVAQSAPTPVNLNFSIDEICSHVVFETQNGPTYVVEYCDDLASPSWTTLNTVWGDGLTHDEMDFSPRGNGRFYRVLGGCP